MTKATVKTAQASLRTKKLARPLNGILALP
jgi:hypothetical protein